MTKKLTTTFKLRVGLKELGEWKQLAATDDMTLAAWIRERCGSERIPGVREELNQIKKMVARIERRHQTANDADAVSPRSERPVRRRDAQ
jgi:hypothetical protein